MFATFQATDTVILILLIGFTVWGFGHGLIKALGGVIGIFVSVFLTSRFFLWVGGLIQPFFGPYPWLANIVAFALLFVIIGKLFNLLVALFQKAFDIIAFLPFLKSFNRILGAIFGFLLGAFFIGAILLVASKYSGWFAFNDAISSSKLAQLVLYISQPLQKVLPTDVLKLPSFF